MEDASLVWAAVGVMGMLTLALPLGAMAAFIWGMANYKTNVPTTSDKVTVLVLGAIAAGFAIGSVPAAWAAANHEWVRWPLASPLLALAAGIGLFGIRFRRRYRQHPPEESGR